MKFTLKNTKVGILSMLMVIGLLAVIAIIPWLSEMAQQTELNTLDLRYRHFNRKSLPNKNIIVVDIDEETLNRYAESFGRWPWPRYIHKDLISYIGEGAPAMVLFDILFTEPQKDGNDDALLAEASAHYENVSHAALFLNETGLESTAFDPLPKDRAFPPSPVWASEPEHWFTDQLFHSVALPNQKLWKQTPYLHSVGVAADSDGILRRLPLLVHYDQQWINTLALQGVLAHWKNEKPRLTFEAPHLIISNHENKVLRQIPIDSTGQLPLHYYSNLNQFEQIRASQIFASIQARDQGQIEKIEIPPDFFTNKVVIIGTSAMGLNDLKVTPIGKQVPGVFLHATGISNIINGDFLKELPSATGYWVGIFFALVGSFCIFFFEGFFIKNILPALLALTYGLASIFFFQNQNINLPLAIPVLSILITYFHGYAYLSLLESKRRKMIEGTLCKYLSPALTKQLIDSGINPTAEVGNWKELSILFSDIRGFTSLSEKIDPAFLVTVLNDYLSAMTDIVFEYEGTLDKFIGDAVMAFWGAPIEVPEHAKQSVRAALKMTRTLEAFNRDHRQKNYPPLHIGIGVHTGKAIVGNIGSNKRLDYTIIGDNVNLASRLEGMTKEYHASLLISGSTYELVKDEFLCRPIDHVIVKGKTQAIPLYQPLIEKVNLFKEPHLEQLHRRFSEAFEFYQKGHFDAALAQFKTLLELFPEDGPTLVYIERCQHLIAAPPLHWQGVFVATKK